MATSAFPSGRSRPYSALRGHSMPLLSVVVGGAGTLFGPVVGSVFLVVLSEVFANTLGQAHLIIFGFVFILVVLFLPQGLMGGADLLQPSKRCPSRPEAERESSEPAEGGRP